MNSTGCGAIGIYLCRTNTKFFLLKAQVTFEEGIATVLTIRDFTQIFDAYAEFLESVVSALMDSLANPDADEDEADVAETEQELDERMKVLEELMDRRPFLINDVLLRRNPNDVQEWEKRVVLWGDNDDKVCQCLHHPVRCSLLNRPNGRWQKCMQRPSRLLVLERPHRTTTTSL